MKRWIAALLCAMMTVMPALAENVDPFSTPPSAANETPRPTPPTGADETPQPTPPSGADETPRPTPPAGEAFPHGEDAAKGSIELTVHGERVRLAFDSSPQYSSIAGGLVQASYYAYGADGFTMYELYIIFSDTARPGMVITPEYAALAGEECSVVLIESTGSNELYYSASVMNGAVYPEGSGFSIAIEGVDATGDDVSYSGSLRATLVALDTVSGAPVATLTIDETPFSFTVRRGDGETPLPPLVPQSSPMPNDMRKV